MRTRIFAVLGILLIFRILAHIPVPLAEPETLKQVLENLFTADTSQLLNVVNILSGGALANFSIMLVGLGPYINASIIMQLLRRAIPKFEAMQKEGEYGIKKLNQYTRMLTLPLAILQSIGAIYLIRQLAQSVGGIGDITAGASIMQWVLMVATMTGGAMLLMWMGELITERSIGNGISLLITVGIISQLPSFISQLWNSVFDGVSKWTVLGQEFSINSGGLLIVGIILASTLIVTWMVVKINEAAKRITVHYAKRVQGNRAYGGVTTVLPVKLIAAGVIPIIFAVAFLSVPSFVGQILSGSDSESMRQLGANLASWFQAPSAATFVVGEWQSWIYPAVYFALVFMFTYFYTNITFNSKEIAENLQKQGGFIEGVRSGAQTEKHLNRTVNRLTLFGAAALGALAILPIIGQAFLSTDIALGGTSILILVAVSLETLRALESRALMVTYDQYSEPNFFQDAAEEDIESPKKRRFSLLPRRHKNK